MRSRLPRNENNSCRAVVSVSMLHISSDLNTAEQKAHNESQLNAPGQSEVVDMEEYGRILGIGEPDELAKLLE